MTMTISSENVHDRPRLRIFLAGATGVIGIRLLPLLIAEHHTVAGMTRSPEKIDQLRALGAEPIICDVFDSVLLTKAVTTFQPDAVIHQLTDLPDDVDQLPDFGARNDAFAPKAPTTSSPPPRRQASGTSSRKASPGDPQVALRSSTNTSAKYSTPEASWFATAAFTDLALSTRTSFRRPRAST
jgi:hypothetical protein